MNAIESSIANFSMLGKSLYISRGSQETRIANSSNTYTSVEDDEILAIFSDTMNIWSFNNADSSGGSQGKGSSVNELNETVSLTMRNNAQNEPSSKQGGFQMVPENPCRPKRPRWDMRLNHVFNIDFKQPSSSLGVEEADPEAIARMKEMVYRAAAFRPVTLGMEVVEKAKRKNVRISSDPQTVAARRRRERPSERVRVLQRLVPGGTKMDTASMLQGAANYLKFLKSQVRALESSPPFFSVPFNQSFPHANPFSTPKP